MIDCIYGMNQADSFPFHSRLQLHGWLVYLWVKWVVTQIPLIQRDSISFASCKNTPFGMRWWCFFGRLSLLFYFFFRNIHTCTQKINFSLKWFSCRTISNLWFTVFAWTFFSILISWNGKLVTSTTLLLMYMRVKLNCHSSSYRKRAQLLQISAPLYAKVVLKKNILLWKQMHHTSVNIYIYIGYANMFSHPCCLLFSCCSCHA